MADVEIIRRTISEIARRRKNVTAEEIGWLVDQLREYYPVLVCEAKHGKLVTLGCRSFMVNVHNPGSKQVKPYSVDDFIDAMIDLGWYEE